MNPEIAMLTRRLEMLEMQLQNLATWAGQQNDGHQTVVAGKFIVCDAHGVRRAELGTVIPEGQSDERPWLGLFDANQNVRACMGAGLGDDPEGAWLELYGPNQTVAVNVATDAQGPRIFMLDAKGGPAIAAHVSENGPVVAVFHAGGKKLSISLDESGEPRLVLENASGDREIKLTVEPGDHA